jgi:hypothetical protein
MVSHFDGSKSLNHLPYLFSQKMEKLPFPEITSLLVAG